MILARYFIGEESIEYKFDENQSISNAIDHLSMLYYEKMFVMPIAVYLSPDLYKLIMTQNVRYHNQLEMPGIQAMQFYTSIGTVMVKPVKDNVQRFIYAGNEEGYHNALATAKMDKHFEDLVLDS